jgi:hypothetical protein
MPRRKLVPEFVTDLSDSKRLEILNEHAMLEGQDWKSVDDTMFCHHCDREFAGRSVRIFKNPRFPDGYEVQCGTEGCDGSPLDWSKRPWWRAER